MKGWQGFGQRPPTGVVFPINTQKITGTEDAEGESSGEQASRTSKEEKLPDDSGSGMSPWGFFLYVKDAFLFMFS